MRGALGRLERWRDFTLTGAGRHNGAMEDERETLTYELFGVAVREVAQAVADSGFAPSMVLCISRGGLAFGGGLAYALDLKAISAVNIEFYTGVGTRALKPVMLPPTPPARELSGHRVLVADDVADSGKTLALVAQYCAGFATEMRTAVIYDKPTSILTPDFSWRSTSRWINFPWSTLPPVTAAGVERP